MGITSGITALTLVSIPLLLLVNADDELPNHYASNPSIVTIKSCCDLRIFPPARVSSGVYKMSMGIFGTANVYCDMTTDDGALIETEKLVLLALIGTGENMRMDLDSSWLQNFGTDFKQYLSCIHYNQ